MSLIVCSNQEKDGKSLRQSSSVYNAWSFRNPLSSTMTIPANAQIALQSCKVNVDGRVVFSGNNNRFYHYLGEKLDLDGSTAPQNEDTTSQSVLVDLLSDDQKGEVLELSVDEFAGQIQDRVRQETFHPSFKGKFTCDPLRNASSLDFLGYKLTYAQEASVENKKADLVFDKWYSNAVDVNFTYTGADGVFKRNASIGSDANDLPAVGLAPTLPFAVNASDLKHGHLHSAFVVNIRNGSFANVQASGVPWQVGLSRCVNIHNPDGRYYPEYADETNDDGYSSHFPDAVFGDFIAGRSADDDTLRIYHNVMDDNYKDGTTLVAREVKYWLNASSDFNGAAPFNLATGTDASQYTKIGYFGDGEAISVKLYNASGAGTWEVVCEYSPTERGDSMFKPVNQACWCLHPFLNIDIVDDTTLDCTMQIEEFDVPSGLTGYAQPTGTRLSNAGWWELNEALNTEFRCQALEMRSWNKPTSAVPTYTYKQLNSENGIKYQAVLVLEPQSIYRGADGANGKAILGFNAAVVDTPSDAAAVDTNTMSYESDTPPDLQSSMAMFVRLNNFTQNVVNAYTGNNSKILAHLPRFDNNQSTGRLYFEPNNLIFIDLDNPSPLQVNEFDISFCYVNEQFATTLTGQSIVCLYIREKPKM